MNRFIPVILFELFFAAFMGRLLASAYSAEIIVRTIQNLSNAQDVDRLVNDAYENNMATIVIGVKQDEDDEAPSGYVFYDSGVAPSAGGYANDDLLTSLIAKAHAKGIAVKAWLPQFHDKAAIEKNPAWQMIAYNGSNVFPYTGNGAAWFINPIHTDAQAYELAIIKEVLQKFDFDGVVLDWIRFDDYNMDLSEYTRHLFKTDFGYDPIDINFASDNSKRRQWNAWREDRIAAYIHKVDSLIETIKPGLPLGVTILSPEWEEVAQNPATFKNDVDFVAPMCYYDDWGYPLDWIYGPRDDAILLVTKDRVGNRDIIPVFDTDWSDADYKMIFAHLTDDYPQINTVGWFEYGRWSRGSMARIQAVSQFGQPFPINEGKIIFHRYSDYAAGDGELYIYDFDKKRLDNISDAWRAIVHHTINAHFSPDGKRIVFMGLPAGKSSYYDWDVYSWDFDGAPQNLTAGNGLPDEDPKFFADGRRFVFKQNGDVKIMDLATKKNSAVTADGFSVEESMPYPTLDGQKIVYAKSSQHIAHSQIHIMDVNGGGDRLLSDEAVAGYYPIVRDADSFLYPRWASSDDHHDQIYLAYFSGQATPCPFNDVAADNSDPYPVQGTNFVFFSSNRKGGNGSWDLYLGDLESGDVWSLASFGVNSSRAELGVSYFSDSSAIIVNPPALPTDYDLGQNYPNPFNASTKISFSLPESAYAEIDLFDARGRFVQRLLQGTMAAGTHSLKWTTEKTGSGVYFYRLSTAGFVQVKKAVYLR